MTYAQSYRPFTKGDEGDIRATIQELAADYRRGILTQTQAIEALRQAGAYETEIATIVEA